MNRLPSISVRVQPFSHYDVEIHIDVQQSGKENIRTVQYFPRDMFRSDFDYCMQVVIDAIHRFYAEEGHIE